MSDDAVGGPPPRVLAGVGAFLFALAAALLVDAGRLPPPAALGVGPTAAMRLVAALLAILGVAHFVSAWRQRSVRLAAPGERPNRAALAWVLGGLVGMIVCLVVGGGFVLGSAGLFVATAAAFGERIRIKLPLIALALAVAVFAFFTKGLSLSLPSGPVERLLLGA
ncbi:tripartite tricarboxylate transporter TctB family protein [Rhizobacter sp. LjRoot28]|uniref:tripartite tricarboxylate transporter TctB family protein n=1 Tax=Rhizobacter sp. LjRoot28 TaxID=3342309 RepID=UPI003ECDB0F8